MMIRILTVALLVALPACTPEDPNLGADRDVGEDTGIIDQSDTGTDFDAPADTDDASTETDPWKELPPRPWSSEEAGPFEVGYRFETFVYQPRGNGEEPRELELSIWYPTFEDDADDATYSAFLPRPGVWQNAEPALRDGTPIMLFSHGHQSISAQSYYWTEFLASHGWIVVAPEHKYGTLRDTSPDETENLKSAIYRPQDLSASLDYLLALPSDDPLSGQDSDRVAASGHSLGGYTTLAITGAQLAVDEIQQDCDDGTLSGRYCHILTESSIEIFRQGFLDERVQVGIPMSPPGAFVFRDGLSEVVTPSLLWTADRDARLPNEEEGDPIWESLSAPSMVRTNVLDAGHFTLSNMCDFLGNLDFIRDDGCGDDFIASDVIHPLNNAYCLEFLRAHLDLQDSAQPWFTDDHEPLHPSLHFSFPSP